MAQDDFVCPCCGGQISKYAHFCKHCGSDEQTGWSSDTYLDGLDLPNSHDYDEIRNREFGKRKGHRPRVNWRLVVGGLVLLAMILLVLRNAVF